MILAHIFYRLMNSYIFILIFLTIIVVFLSFPRGKNTSPDDEETDDLLEEWILMNDLEDLDEEETDD